MFFFGHSLFACCLVAGNAMLPSEQQSDCRAVLGYTRLYMCLCNRDLPRKKDKKLDQCTMYIRII